MLAEAVQNLSGIEYRKGGLRMFLMFFRRRIPCKNTKNTFFCWSGIVINLLTKED